MTGLTSAEYRYLTWGLVLGVWVSQGVAIAAVFAAAPVILSDSAQIYTSVAFFSWIIGVGFLVLALLRGVVISLKRAEVVGVLSAVIPIVIAVALALWLLIPLS